jgi:hypothetical protein
VPCGNAGGGVASLIIGVEGATKERVRCIQCLYAAYCIPYNRAYTAGPSNISTKRDPIQNNNTTRFRHNVNSTGLRSMRVLLICGFEEIPQFSLSPCDPINRRHPLTLPSTKWMRELLACELAHLLNRPSGYCSSLTTLSTAPFGRRSKQE